MAQRSARPDRDNQARTNVPRVRGVDVDPVRELPYRPAAVRRRIRGRTDGSIRPRALTALTFLLARKGASTDGAWITWGFALIRRTRMLLDTNGDRHAEAGHSIEDVATELCLGLLTGQSPGVETPADDGLVSVHRRFNEAPS
jgi:hypothetical protein